MAAAARRGGRRAAAPAASRSWASTCTSASAPTPIERQRRRRGVARADAQRRHEPRRRRGRLLGRHPPARRAGPRGRAGGRASAAASLIDRACRTSGSQRSTRSASARRSRAAATAWSRPATPCAEVVADRLLGGARASSPRPTCPPSSSCSASTWPASATRWASPRTASRSSSTTPVNQHLRQAGALRRRQDAARRHPGRRRVGVRHAAADGRRTAARRSAGADRAGRIRRRQRRIGRRRAARRRADLLVQQRHQGRSARRDRASGCCDVPALKTCTQAGTTCGSCVPLLKQLLEAEGVEQSKALCEHFSQSRAELFEIVSAVHRHPHLLRADRAYGTGQGCDICKPGGRVDPGVDELRAHPRRRAGHAAGHQRPLPGQHPAQRHATRSCRACPAARSRPSS